MSAAGYRKYTAYRARQVDAVMARARRLARGEGGAPALLDLGSGGELLQVMAPCDLLTSGALINGTGNGKEVGATPSRKGSVDILAAAKAAARRGSVDNLSVRVTEASFGPAPRRSGDAPVSARRQGGSTENLLDDGVTPPTIELCPGMVVVPVYLEEWSSTVEVYMPDEHEAPLWLYSDMLLLFWLAVLLGSLGHMLLNAAFIVLGAAFHTRPSLTVDVLCGVLGSVGGETCKETRPRGKYFRGPFQAIAMIVIKASFLITYSEVFMAILLGESATYSELNEGYIIDKVRQICQGYKRTFISLTKKLP